MPSQTQREDPKGEVHVKITYLDKKYNKIKFTGGNEEIFQS
jgi:hypothetical protein